MVLNGTDFEFNEYYFNTSIFISQTLGSVINITTLIIMLKYSPAAMGNYKWYLFTSEVFSVLLDFGMDTLTKPVFFFPHVAGAATGWFTSIMGLSTFQVYVIMMTFGDFCITAIFCPLFYRYHVLLEDYSFFKFKSLSTVILVFDLIVASSIGLFCYLPYQSEEAARNYFKKNQPDDAAITEFPEFYALDKRSTLTIISFLWMLFWILWASSVVTFCYVGCINILNENTSSMSEKTRKMHLEFLRTLTIQTFIPFLCLLVPVFYWVAGILIGLRFPGHQKFNNISVIMTCCHGTVASMCLLAVNKCYREPLIGLFKRFVVFWKPSSIVKTVDRVKPKEVHSLDTVALPKQYNQMNITQIVQS